MQVKRCNLDNFPGISRVASDVSTEPPFHSRQAISLDDIYDETSRPLGLFRRCRELDLRFPVSLNAGCTYIFVSLTT